MKTLQNRWGAFLLVELGIVVALLLFACFETNSPRARTSVAPPFASASTAPDTVEETVTLTPANLKTWIHLDHAYPSNTTHWPCGLSARGLGASYGPRGGEIVVGYEHFFDAGTKPLPCQERIDHMYRGTVRFDVGDIVAKAPPLHVFVKKATLNYKPTGDCPNQLLIAAEDWVKGSPADLVKGDLFAELGPCGIGNPAGCSFDVSTVVNNWVRGAEHEGYSNYGFVLRGNNEINSEDNDTCITRYSNFSLTVTYKYDRTLIFPTETPTPAKAIAVGRAVPDLSLPPTNFALASNGATATAQNYTQDSVYPGSHFQPSYAIDGKRYLHLAPPPNDADGFWRDEHGLPSWLQVDFGGTKTITDVVLYTVPDYPDYLKQYDPSRGLMFKSYGVTAFDVMYWTGSAWAIVPGGSITGNTYVLTHLKFSPAIKTSKIRVVVKAAPDNIARIVEIEAYPVSSSKIGPL